MFRGPRLLSAAVMGYGSSSTSPAEVKKETFWDMLRLVFCPLFSVASFIFWITIFDLAIYVPLIAVDYDTHRFLEPTPQALDWFGAKNAYEMQHGQVWRWFTPMVLHGNVFHIIYNIIMQMIIGFRLEPAVGWLTTAVIYITSGCGGILLSALIKPDSLSAGASTAIFGITTALVLSMQIALIIMKWDELDGGINRVITLIWLSMLLVFNLMGSFVSTRQGPGVDLWGHLGGLIVGFALGFALFSSKSAVTWWMMAFLALYFVGGVLLFYLLVPTDPIDYDD